MKKLVILALVLSATTLQVSAAGDAAAGKNKAAVCGACHGVDGNSASPQFPKLAGQNASYIQAQLQNFKSGKRQNPIMSGQAQNLSEQDMQDLAAYFSSQTVTTGEAEAGQEKQGESLFHNGNKDESVPACAACHSADGAGNYLMKVPSLAGQHAGYVVAQLQAYAAGTRTTDPSKMMESIAARLTPAEMQAVASYIQGLHAAKPQP
ncbi:MAG: c-type cytochrome [Bacillota bacterium]